MTLSIYYQVCVLLMQVLTKCPDKSSDQRKKIRIYYICDKIEMYDIVLFDNSGYYQTSELINIWTRKCLYLRSQNHRVWPFPRSPVECWMASHLCAQFFENEGKPGHLPSLLSIYEIIISKPTSQGLSFSI